MMPEVLEQETQTYEQHKPELMSKAEGKFVLIKGQEVCGVFETMMDAVSQGYERFGNVPFLVKQILEVETPQNFTSNLLGI